jgi:hypothetical protein
MSTVRIWAVKSDHDAKMVKRLADKLLTDSRLGNLSIRTADKKAFLNRNGKSLSDTLKKATRHYLQQDDCVIFVADLGPPMPTHQQPKELDSLSDHIEQIVDDDRFAGRVFLAQGVQELKAWLPVACKSLGIDSTAWQKKWDSIVAPFHDAFANTPEEQVVRDLEEALAEVRRERT